MQMDIAYKLHWDKSVEHEKQLCFHCYAKFITYCNNPNQLINSQICRVHFKNYSTTHTTLEIQS